VIVSVSVRSGGLEIDFASESFSSHAALHNSLISLESGAAAAQLNGSPQLLSGSSRRGDSAVEIVNHSRTVLRSPACGWAFRGTGEGAGELLYIDGNGTARLGTLRLELWSGT
jgi:hypothetical protein